MTKHIGILVRWDIIGAYLEVSKFSPSLKIGRQSGR